MIFEVSNSQQRLRTLQAVLTSVVSKPRCAAIPPSFARCALVQLVEVDVGVVGDKSSYLSQ